MNETEDLVLMTNLYPRTTGLPMVVWVGPSYGAPHDARIKVMQVHGTCIRPRQPRRRRAASEAACCRRPFDRRRFASGQPDPRPLARSDGRCRARPAVNGGCHEHRSDDRAHLRPGGRAPHHRAHDGGDRLVARVWRQSEVAPASGLRLCEAPCDRSTGGGRHRGTNEWTTATACSTNNQSRLDPYRAPCGMMSRSDSVPQQAATDTSAPIAIPGSGHQWIRASPSSRLQATRRARRVIVRRYDGRSECSFASSLSCRTISISAIPYLLASAA